MECFFEGKVGFQVSAAADCSAIQTIGESQIDVTGM